MLKIAFNDKKMINHLTHLKTFFDTGLKSEMEAIGNENIKETQNRLYTTKRTPTNSPFASLSSQYAEWKVKYHGSEDIGVLSGKMARSMGKTVESNGNETVLTVGNTATSKGFPYPVVFQLGKHNQPVRPFVGFGDKEAISYFNRLFKALGGVK